MHPVRDMRNALGNRRPGLPLPARVSALETLTFSSAEDPTRNPAEGPDSALRKASLIGPYLESLHPNLPMKGAK